MAESYAREITKRAVATAAIALDFKQSYSNVLESLSDVVRQYIEKISILSKEQAEIAGRSVPGTHDVLVALEMIAPESTNWRELRDFAFESTTQRPGSTSSSSSSSGQVTSSSSSTDNINSDTIKPRLVNPFPLSVPSFPSNRRRGGLVPESSTVSGGLGLINANRGERGDHIPEHLPLFPPDHTYIRSEPASKRRRLASKKAQKVKQATDSKRVSRSLAKINNDTKREQNALNRLQNKSSSSSSSSSSSNVRLVVSGTAQPATVPEETTAAPTASTSSTSATTSTNNTNTNNNNSDANSSGAKIVLKGPLE